MPTSAMHVAECCFLYRHPCDLDEGYAANCNIGRYSRLNYFIMHVGSSVLIFISVLFDV